MTLDISCGSNLPEDAVRSLLRQFQVRQKVQLKIRSTYSAPHQVDFFFSTEVYDKGQGLGLGWSQGKGKGWDKVSDLETLTLTVTLTLRQKKKSSLVRQ